MGEAMGDFPAPSSFNWRTHLSIVDLPTFIAVAAAAMNVGNGVMLIEYKLGGFEAKLWAKITSVTSGHNVTCF
ncbi:Uncharacterised protein [Serratia proteamaculans]|nr:Uncharacterised protein [Serratia proteamaculans]CAI1843939.1 Uncharacterised protein [Serratia proteamaculans]